jgi:hypothetical protein
MNIDRGNECMLLDNNLFMWRVRDPTGREGLVPSVMFRIPPPDERALELLSQLQAYLLNNLFLFR